MEIIIVIWVRFHEIKDAICLWKLVKYFCTRFVSQRKYVISAMKLSLVFAACQKLRCAADSFRKVEKILTAVVVSTFIFTFNLKILEVYKFSSNRRYFPSKFDDVGTFLWARAPAHVRYEYFRMLICRLLDLNLCLGRGHFGAGISRIQISQYKPWYFSNHTKW